MSSLVQSPAWQALSRRFAEVRDLEMRGMFEKDPQRAARFSLRFEDWLVDCSKNRATDETMRLLVAVAEQAGVPAMREKMFAGDKINNTENRAVLHVALRNRSSRPVLVDGQDVMP